MRFAGELAQRLHVGWRMILKEVGAFGTVGAVCLIVDLALFQLLYAHLGVGPISSKFAATVLSVSLAYLGHRYWSFSHRARVGMRKESAFFFLVNGATLLMGMGLVAIARYIVHVQDPWALQLVNVASIGLGTVVRFVAYRRWVFTREGGQQTR